MYSYSGESQEQQTRLLADISLLLQNYDLSYQLYHTLKGDYKGDRAWMYYAGAMVSSNWNILRSYISILRNPICACFMYFLIMSVDEVVVV